MMRVFTAADPASRLTFACAMAGVVLLSLASRRWRTTAVPWGAVPILALSLEGEPFQVLAGSLLLLLVELPGGLRLLVELLAVPAAACGGLAAVRLVGEPLALLTVLYLLALAIGRLGRSLAGAAGVRNAPLPADLAGLVVLLGGSVLCSLGWRSGQPLPAILGLVIPLVLPALLAYAPAREGAGHALEPVFSSLPRLVDSLGGPEAQTLDDLVLGLHELIQPVLAHSVTVAAINPPFATEGATLGAHPVAGETRLRIGERLRRLFQSRKAHELAGPVITAQGGDRSSIPSTTIRC